MLNIVKRSLYFILLNYTNVVKSVQSYFSCHQYTYLCCICLDLRSYCLQLAILDFASNM